MNQTPESQQRSAASGTLSVIGLGYIGLPTAAMFASNGVHVTGVDISQRAVDAVNSGTAHIEEGELDELVGRCVGAGFLRATTSAVAADNFIIAVPTPAGHDANHSPDVSYVRAAGESIAPVLKKGDLVILESTSPVGTTGMLSELFAAARPDLRFPHQAGENADVCIAYCPERIIPGRMLQELVENDRIIGGMTQRCAVRASDLYKIFVRGTCHLADDRTAEMVKLTENAFRDVNIAFANELSMICAGLGVDAWKVVEFANRHPRVNILNPGPGVGGHCIAVDPWFIVATSPERAKLIRAAREINDAKTEFVIDQVEHAMAELPDAKVACLGLSYKPDVDDFRESPAFEIAARLSAHHGARVLSTDPYAHALPEEARQKAGLTIVSPEQAIKDATIIVMLVGHTAFRAFSSLEGKRVLDTVGYWR
ncbi:UDP-N-acetyl-D-mannosamine dehydrogenase [Luteimonas lutimaris]|uniref:UDP-N-acetyl-D-mannosamine dehydrogenase n=1 Tax=Luteimonas lutimaris TaxID=698645 RepID=A0ABP7MWP8_9GAMM